jgi:hypothetical protein
MRELLAFAMVVVALWCLFDGEAGGAAMAAVLTVIIAMPKRA